MGMIMKIKNFPTPQAKYSNEKLEDLELRLKKAFEKQQKDPAYRKSHMMELSEN